MAETTYSAGTPGAQAPDRRIDITDAERSLDLEMALRRAHALACLLGHTLDEACGPGRDEIAETQCFALRASLVETTSIAIDAFHGKGRYANGEDGQ